MKVFKAKLKVFKSDLKIFKSELKVFKSEFKISKNLELKVLNLDSYTRAVVSRKKRNATLAKKEKKRTHVRVPLTVYVSPAHALRGWAVWAGAYAPISFSGANWRVRAH